MSICVFILSKLNMFYNEECATITESDWLPQFYQNSLSIKNTLLYTFWSVPFCGDMSINAVLWMLKYILLGSIIAILLGVTYKGTPKVTYIWVLVLFIHYYQSDSLYVCAVIGATLAILHNKTKDINVNNYASGVAFVIASIGFIIGGYSGGDRAL